MLVLSRNVGKSIKIDGDITIHVLGVRGNQVSLGIDAPRDVKVLRSELVEDKEKANVRRNEGQVNINAA